MVRKRLAIRNGKAVMVDRPKKPKKYFLNPDHWNTGYDKPIVDNTPVLTPLYDKFPDSKYTFKEHTYIFESGECGNCGKRFNEEKQKICEGCGVNLSRM